jgi:transcriptional regulator with XRE-family HTH domain
MTRLDGGIGESRSLDPALGRTIEAARRRQGWTQAGLAANCGMSRRHLASIEAGANFSVAILLDLARALPGEVLPVGEFLLVRVPGRSG